MILLAGPLIFSHRTTPVGQQGPVHPDFGWICSWSWELVEVLLSCSQEWWRWATDEPGRLHPAHRAIRNTTYVLTLYACGRHQLSVAGQLHQLSVIIQCSSIACYDVYISVWWLLQIDLHHHWHHSLTYWPAACMHALIPYRHCPALSVCSAVAVCIKYCCNVQARYNESIESVTDILICHLASMYVQVAVYGMHLIKLAWGQFMSDECWHMLTYQ